MSKLAIKDTNNIPKLTKTLKKLGKKQIKVGVFGDKYHPDADISMAAIAGVHEFGADIKPRNAKYLAIPSHKRSKGKSPRDFKDLFFIPTNKGGLLAKEKGKDSFEVYFVLMKHVKIPERSFIRAGFDKHVNDITDKIADMMDDVLALGINPDVFLDAIGTEFASLIQDYATDLDSPPKAKVTLAASPTKTNPLLDSGRMIGSIRHEVE